MTSSSAQLRHFSAAEHKPAAGLRFNGVNAQVVNMPSNPINHGVVGLTPQLSQLIDDAWPLVTHVMERRDRIDAQPVYLFYINPRDPLENSAAALLDMLRSLNGQGAVWVPLSTSHAAILHTLRLILPELAGLSLQDATLLYIGDNANCAPMAAMAKESQFPFVFHALY